MANWPSVLPDAQIEAFNQSQVQQVSDEQDQAEQERQRAAEEERQRAEQLAATRAEAELFDRNATTEPQTPAEHTDNIQTDAPVPAERRPGADRFSPYDDTFRKYMGDQAGNSELVSIIAAATRAESKWDPQAVGDNGHSVGLFQMHDQGAGAGMSRESRADPDAASAKMVPAFIAAYAQVKAANPNLSGAELASLVAARAEKPQGWDDPTSKARNGYRQAYTEVMNGTGAQLAYQPVTAMDDPVAREPILTNNLVNYGEITGRPTSIADYNRQRIQGVQASQGTGIMGSDEVANPLLRMLRGPAPGPEAPSQGVAPAPSDLQAAPTSTGDAAPSAPKVEVPNQFGDPALTQAEALAACGPAAYVAFARAAGRNPSLREAVDLAKQYGWTASKGMAGPASQVQMLNDQGIPATMGPLDPTRIDSELAAGRPVSLSTPGHYFVLTGKNPDGTYYAGASGTAYKAGAESLTLDQMQRIGGTANGVIYMTGGEATPPPAAPQLAEGKTFTGAPTGMQLTSNRIPTMVDDAGIGSPITGTPDVSTTGPVGPAGAIAPPPTPGPFDGLGSAARAAQDTLGAGVHNALDLPNTGENPSPLDVAGSILSTPTRAINDTIIHPLERAPVIGGLNDVLRDRVNDLTPAELAATTLSNPVVGGTALSMRLHNQGPLDLVGDALNMGALPEGKAMEAVGTALPRVSPALAGLSTADLGELADRLRAVGNTDSLRTIAGEIAARRAAGTADVVGATDAMNAGRSVVNGFESGGAGPATGVLFHGTGAEHALDPIQGATVTGNPTSVWGTFFTPSASEAERYVQDFHGGNGVVMSAQVSLDNPYRMSFGENEPFQKLDLARGDLPGQMAELTEKAREFKDSLVKQGYDGIIIGRPGLSRPMEIVAFNAKQIEPQGTRAVGDVSSVVNSAGDLLPRGAGTTDTAGFAPTANSLMGDVSGFTATDLTGTQAMNAPKLPPHLQVIQQGLRDANLPPLNDDPMFGPAVNAWEGKPGIPIGDRVRAIVGDKVLGFERSWLDKNIDLNRIGKPIEQTVALLKGVMGPGVSKQLDADVAPIVRALGTGPELQYFNELTQLEMDMDVARHFPEPRFYASLGSGGPEGTLADLQAMYGELEQRAGPDTWNHLQDLATVRQGVLTDLQQRMVAAGIRRADLADALDQLYPHYNPTRRMAGEGLLAGEHITTGGRNLADNQDLLRRLTETGSPEEKMSPLESFAKAVAEGNYLIAKTEAGQKAALGLLSHTSYSGSSRLSGFAQAVNEAVYRDEAPASVIQDFFELMRQDPKQATLAGTADRVAQIIGVEPRFAAGTIRSETLAATAAGSPVHYIPNVQLQTGALVSDLADPLVASTEKADVATIATGLFGKDPGRMRIPVNGDSFHLSLPADPNVRKEITGLGPDVMNSWMRAASAMNRPLRAGATTLDPRFMTDNPIADAFGLVMRRGPGVLLQYPKALPSAVQQVVRGGNPYVESLVDLGAEGGAGKYQGMDAKGMLDAMRGAGVNVLQDPREAIPQLLRAYGSNLATGVAGGVGAAKVTPEDDPNRTLKIAGGAALGAVFGKPMEKLNQIGEVTGRTAAALDAQKAGATLGQQALEYRRGTVDFGRMGTAVQFLAPLTVFASAQFGGAAAPFRAIGDAANKPGALLRDAALAVGAAGLYGYNRLFPEYKDIPEWMKQNYQIVMLPGSQPNDNGIGYKQINALAIPTREYTLMSYPVTKALEHADGQDPENFGLEMGKFLMGWSPGLATADSGLTGSASAFMPVPIKAFAELQTGKSFYTGKDIEGARVRSLPRTERADERTSAFATSDAGRAIANNPIVGMLAGHQLSPVETDFLLKDVLGGTGRNIESLSNAFAGKEPPPGYTPGASDVLGGIWRTYGGEVQGKTYEEAGKYYASHIDQAVAKAKATPQFQRANPDEQRRILTAVDRAVHTEAQSEAGTPEPRQKDQPWKYVGIQDVTREGQIDRLVSKYDAWVRNGRRGPSDLDPKELQTAINYRVRISPQYTRWMREGRRDAFQARQEALTP